MEFTVNGAKLVLVEGDITKIPADAIVNAANSRLVGGGGVDGAIHRAGGPSIMKELDEMRPRMGRCAAGKLPAKYVIHAVGPVFRDGRHGEPEQLASCYRTSLRVAEEKGARSVSFPSISTGAYGYPMAEAAELAVETVVAYLKQPECRIETVTFALFGRPVYQAHVEAARRQIER